MSQFLTFIDTDDNKYSILATGISYIHWGGIDEYGDIATTDIYIFGKKRPITIDHRLPENQRSLSKIIPVSWETLVFNQEDKN